MLNAGGKYCRSAASGTLWVLARDARRQVERPFFGRVHGDQVTLRKLAFPLLLSLLLVVGGCTTTPILNFSIISTKSLPVEDLGKLERREIRVSGQTEQQVYFIIPVGNVSIRTALERAIDSVPGCVALVDGSIKLVQRVFFPFIYAESKIVVEGTPLIDPTRLDR
jgi:hypothetical protein